MRIIETPAYTFDELSDPAKERARNWYRQQIESDEPAVRILVGRRARDVMALTWNGPLKPGVFVWSLGESVCVLKAVARDIVEREAGELPR